MTLDQFERMQLCGDDVVEENIQGFLRVSDGEMSDVVGELVQVRCSHVAQLHATCEPSSPARR